jgi:hypothetical protein
MSRAWWLTLALLVGGGVASAQPTADAQREAGEHFERGERAQKRGLYHDAIASYEKAHALAPHSNNLFNIAVCYEKLGKWTESITYYERYLEADPNAVDATEVADKLRELRARSGPGPIAPGDSGSSVTDTPPPPVDGRIFTPFVPPPPPKRARWHAGISYGFGIGDAPVERFLAHGGIRLANRFEFDAYLGKFGKNDTAIGGMTRVLLSTGITQPFLHGALTFGYAKSDNSSDASTKVPLGFEAGGGVRFGKQGRFELAGVLRFVRGGFDETSTVFDSYINDQMIIAFDLGVAIDIPLTLIPTSSGR